MRNPMICPRSSLAERLNEAYSAKRLSPRMLEELEKVEGQRDEVLQFAERLSRLFMASGIDATDVPLTFGRGLHDVIPHILPGAWSGHACSSSVRKPLESLMPESLVRWPCDSDLAGLRDAFAESDGDRKRIATQIQVRAMQVGTHIPLGEYQTKLAARKNVSGLVTAPIHAFWNLEKQ